MTEQQPTDSRRDLGTGMSEGLPRRHSGMANLRLTMPEVVTSKGPAHLPVRYSMRTRDEGPVLVCQEAPGMAVSLDRRYCFSEQEAKRLPERSILLDGAGAFAPMIDDAKHLYNLDHHHGCLRAFTLATCEQALILVLKGLELDSGDWTLYANEPDLDTIFSLWVLFNHRRIRGFDAAAHDRIVPLLRLEGAIDANGFELAEACGLPNAVLLEEKARLDRLHERELEIKRSGEWATSDLSQYTIDMLHEIDKLVYRSSDFDDFASIEEEYGHVDIGQGKVAVICRDGSGIYDVEKRLRKTWGDRLGIIALEKERDHYTLRRSASLAGIDLLAAYDKLNLLDPAVDGRPAGKRWGGSDEIGGSPRPTGTLLTPREIGKILKLSYKRVRPLQHLQKFATAVLWSLVLVLSAGVAVVSFRFFSPVAAPPGGALELTLAATIISAAAWLMTRQLSRGWTWLFGWRRAAGRDWWPLAPLVCLAAAFGGSLLPLLPQTVDRQEMLSAVGAIALTAMAVELCFRGLTHGLLVLDSSIQTAGSRWFLSRPNLAATLVSTLVLWSASRFWLGGPTWMPWDLEPMAYWSVVAGGALIASLGLGMIRERSLSLWPGVLALTIGGWIRLALELLK